MTDLTALFSSLRRPKLLVRAARLGQADYARERDLKRLTRRAQTPAPGAAVAYLVEEEARLEEARQTGEVAYSPTRHVDVLIALIAEARLLPRPAPQP